MESRSSSHPIKCMVVGDGYIGKSALIQAFISGTNPHEVTPAVLDVHETTKHNVMVDGQKVSMTIWDTSGGEEYDSVRSLVYPKVDVVLICFSLVSPSSLDNVVNKWFPEVSHRAPKIPILLVGTKLDLCTDPTTLTKLKTKGETPVNPLQSTKMVTTIGATKCVECSAVTCNGVQTVFHEAARYALQRHFPKLKQFRHSNGGIVTTMFGD